MLSRAVIWTHWEIVLGCCTCFSWLPPLLCAGCSVAPWRPRPALRSAGRAVTRITLCWHCHGQGKHQWLFSDRWVHLFTLVIIKCLRRDDTPQLSPVVVTSDHRMSHVLFCRPPLGGSGACDVWMIWLWKPRAECWMRRDQSEPWVAVWQSRPALHVKWSLVYNAPPWPYFTFYCYEENQISFEESRPVAASLHYPGNILISSSSVPAMLSNAR